LHEASEDKIIMLSTHIVEDVRDMCPDMAIMGDGEIIVRGAPEELINKVEGKVWRKQVDKEEADALKKSMPFLSSRFLTGGVIVSVLSDDRPGPGFEQGDVVLEDAYFAHLYKLV
jgi:ABC-type multidrug transport system ATPase subunit